MHMALTLLMSAEAVGFGASHCASILLRSIDADFFFFFLLFRASLMAYGGSQARG